MTDSAYVVVGTDGSAHAGNAVVWAADEAQRRYLPLRIVSVFEEWTSTRPDAEGLRADQEQQATAMLAEAKESTLARYPALQVETVLRIGDVVEELAEQAKTARVLVTGTRGRGGFAGMLLGSTSQALTIRSAAPLVVVPGPPAPDNARIVVGVDGSEESDRALRFAADSALARGVDLVAVQAVPQPMAFGAGEVYGFMLDDILKEAEVAAEDQVAAVRTEHPDLELTTAVELGHPAEVLRRLGDGAQLLVVGSRGRSRARSMLLGSISHGVLHHAPCPVAVLTSQTE